MEILYSDRGLLLPLGVSRLLRGPRVVAGQDIGPRTLEIIPPAYTKLQVYRGQIGDEFGVRDTSLRRLSARGVECCSRIQ